MLNEESRTSNEIKWSFNYFLQYLYQLPKKSTLSNAPFESLLLACNRQTHFKIFQFFLWRTPSRVISTPLIINRNFSTKLFFFLHWRKFCFYWWSRIHEHCTEDLCPVRSWLSGAELVNWSLLLRNGGKSNNSDFGTSATCSHITKVFPQYGISRFVDVSWAPCSPNLCTMSVISFGGVALRVPEEMFLSVMRHFQKASII